MPIALFRHGNRWHGGRIALRILLRSKSTAYRDSHQQTRGGMQAGKSPITVPGSRSNGSENATCRLRQGALDRTDPVKDRTNLAGCRKPSERSRVVAMRTLPVR